MSTSTLLWILLFLIVSLITLIHYALTKDNPIRPIYKEVRKQFRNEWITIKNRESRNPWHGEIAYELTLKSGKKIKVDVYHVDSGSKLMRHHNGVDTEDDYEVYVNNEKITDRDRLHNYSAKKLYDRIKKLYGQQVN